MAFKLKAPYNISITPVYHVDEEEGVLGRANNNGSSIVTSTFVLLLVLLLAMSEVKLS